MASIRRRVAKNAELRQSLREGRSDPKARVLKFIEEMDTELRNAIDDFDRWGKIEVTTMKLTGDMQIIDPEATISLEWLGDDLKSMRLTGVRITWGDAYAAMTGRSKSELIDVSDLLFG